VAYIDPRVDPQTRTAKVRVEVPNRTGELRLGMYVTVASRTEGAGQRTVIPRSAVQTVGDRTLCTCPPPRPSAVRRAPREARGRLRGGRRSHRGPEPGEKIVTAAASFSGGSDPRAIGKLRPRTHDAPPGGET